MSNQDDRPGHAFISYDPEDGRAADWMQHILEAAGIRVWRDAVDLLPGQDRRSEIRKAISEGALVFIACFSRYSLARPRSAQNEELLLAVEQLRMRLPDDPWLIPVRFDDCRVPDIAIGGGRTLASLEAADLFGDDAEAAAKRVVATVGRLLGSDLRTSPQQGRPDAGRRPVAAAPGAGPAGKRTSARSGREGGEGPFTKATAIGTMVLVALTYVLIAYTVTWPPFKTGPSGTSSPDSQHSPNPGASRNPSASSQSSQASRAAHGAPGSRDSIRLKPGSIVPECASISGTAIGIPDSHNLWLFIEIGDSTQTKPGHIYYPLAHSLQVNSRSAWSVDMQLGEDGEDGLPYWLILFTSDHSVTNLDPTNSLSVLPPGFASRPLAMVMVRRGKSNAVAGKCRSYAQTRS